jgi:hypothetical protein
VFGLKLLVKALVNRKIFKSLKLLIVTRQKHKKQTYRQRDRERDRLRDRQTDCGNYGFRILQSQQLCIQSHLDFYDFSFSFSKHSSSNILCSS